VTADTDPGKPITIRAWGVPTGYKLVIRTQAEYHILQAFLQQYPHIRPVSSTGLALTGGTRTNDFVPFMQIAGGIAPDVLQIGFRHSQTYIQNKLLYPLDKYVESMLDVEIANGPLMTLEDYLAELRKSPKYELEITRRFPESCWDVIRRECPYAEECPYCKTWGLEAASAHHHVWCFPQKTDISIMGYRRDYFMEAGLDPDKPPATWEEFIAYARRLTDPEIQRYGLWLGMGEELALNTIGFLYSMGGRLLEQDDQGNWRCTFDSEAAVETYYFVARLFHEPFVNAKGKRIEGVVFRGDKQDIGRSASIYLSTVPQEYFAENDPSLNGLAPVPAGPDGLRVSAFNTIMSGIYAGLEDDPATRDAAWNWLHFFRGAEARKIWAKVYVEKGVARYSHANILQEAGYEQYIHEINPGWAKAYRQAWESNAPQPYGENCQMVFTYVGKALDQIRTDRAIRKAIVAGDTEKGKALVRDILKERARRTNEKMLDIITPEQRKTRTTVASVTAVAILIIFVFIFRMVFRTFSESVVRDINASKSGWSLGRYKWAWLLLLPAVGSIALWNYYPLIHGSVMAFQDYNVRGFSEFTGMENFANVLFDDEFWYSMWIALKYTLIFMIFGFTAPIALAFLLTEVPRGKILFRVIYYLPAVLSGVLVIFLWRGFYGPSGMINEVLNFFVMLFNGLPGVEIETFQTRWLEEPDAALICVLLPVIWAGMGPGCLIYLAALKTIPEESYEAADIDGAGIWHKVFHVAIPAIKGLIVINFIGVMVATVKGGSEFALAMTGGGPYTPYGQTEMVGLHIYWQAFGYLRFGAAAAMAWVLGAMLVGFTVIQMKRLSRMEFKTAGGQT
jgi:multiple sugar transport system permease protein